VKLEGKLPPLKIMLNYHDEENLMHKGIAVYTSFEKKDPLTDQIPHDTYFNPKYIEIKGT